MSLIVTLWIDYPRTRSCDRFGQVYSIMVGAFNSAFVFKRATICRSVRTAISVEGSAT